MLGYNINGTVQGHRQLQEETAPSYLHRIQYIAKILTSWLPVRYFSQYAGTATGYGFFAPQVGSSFLLEVTALDDQDTARATVCTPKFKQAHSMLRYYSLLNRMQNLVGVDGGDKGESALPLRQAKAIAHCLSLRIARRRWTNMPHRIRCEVFVYGSTKLSQQSASLGRYRTSIYHTIINQPPSHDYTLFLHPPLSSRLVTGTSIRYGLTPVAHRPSAMA